MTTLFSDLRKPLSEILEVPDRIEKTISLDEHVWKREGKLAEAEYELSTVRNYFITPEIRLYLYDILGKISAGEGQGWWIQAEFGSGKSHLLSFITIMTLAGDPAWKILSAREEEANLGKRESLAQFQDIKDKMVFPIVKNLVGAGGARPGTGEAGKPLIDYIVEEAQDSYHRLTGNRLIAFPDEMLVQYFFERHYETFKEALATFLSQPSDQVPRRMSLEEFVGFAQDLENLRDAGRILGAFYRDLRVKPEIPADAGEILTHVAKTILDVGFDGILIVLDEVSEFLRNSSQLGRDEDTLHYLSYNLVRAQNLPVWTICAAQQRIEEKVSAKKILSDERLKPLSLLQEENTYYSIVLARTRKIPEKNFQKVEEYYNYYKDRFDWVASLTPEEFRYYFPFSPEEMRLTRHLTYRLTTARSGIAVLHSALKKNLKRNENITTDKIFDEFEAITAEEARRSVEKGDFEEKAGFNLLSAVFREEYNAFLVGKARIEASAKFTDERLEKALRVLKTLFMYKLGGLKESLTAEEVADCVMLPRSEEAAPRETIDYFQLLLEDIAVELPQVKSDPGKERFWFEPKSGAIDPQDIFDTLKLQLKDDLLAQERAWKKILSLKGGLKYKTGFGERIFAEDVSSDFASFAEAGQASLGTVWCGKEIKGIITLKDITNGNIDLPAEIKTDQTGEDFRIVVCLKPAEPQIDKLIASGIDKRYIFWSPQPFSALQQEDVLDFTVFDKMLTTYGIKKDETADAVINWTADKLEMHLGKMQNILISIYKNGKIKSATVKTHDFNYATIATVVKKVVGDILDNLCESKDIEFQEPRVFQDDDAIKMIQGLIAKGKVDPSSADKYASAAQNFGRGLGLIGEDAGYRLDLSSCKYAQQILTFIKGKIDEKYFPMRTIYKNFMGIPKGLTRRMVQMYVAALIADTRLRAHVKPGLVENNIIDYENISKTDFSAKLLDSFESVSLVGEIGDWNSIRPFVAVILDEETTDTQDEKVVRDKLEKVTSVFENEKVNSTRASQELTSFFLNVGRTNPWKNILAQWENLFAESLDVALDMKSVILKNQIEKTFGYDLGTTKSSDIGDFKDKWSTYNSLLYFVNSYKDKVALAFEYAKEDISEDGQTKEILEQIDRMSKLTEELKSLALEEVRLKNQFDPIFEKLVSAYFMVYKSRHQAVLEESKNTRLAVGSLLSGEELPAIKRLDEVPALGDCVYDNTRGQVESVLRHIPSCDVDSPEDLRNLLLGSATCKCLLSIGNAAQKIEDCREIGLKTEELVTSALKAKCDVLVTKDVRERLEETATEKKDKSLYALLAIETSQQLSEEISGILKKYPKLIDLLKEVLKQVLIVLVRWRDIPFRSATVTRENLQEFAQDLQGYLEKKMSENEKKGLKVILRLED